jgi:hypothetical protein
MPDEKQVLPTATAELFDKAKKRCTMAQDAKANLRRQWRLAEAFLVGEHWMNWNEQGEELVNPPKSPDWKPRLTINHVQRYYRKELGRMTVSRPLFECVPPTPDIDDWVSARLCDQLIHHFDRAMKLRLIDSSWKADSITYGSGFVKVLWDKDGKDDLGRAVGEISVKVLSPWEVSIYPANVQSIDDAEWVFHTTQISLDEAKQRYGVTAEGLKAGEGTDPQTGMIRRFLEKIRGAFGYGSEPIEKDNITIVEGWRNPDAMYPQGVLITWCGDKILQEPVNFPYLHGHIPIRLVRYTEIPDSIYGAGLLYDLALCNARYNRTASQLMELTNLVIGGGKWWIPTECEVHPDSITSDPGEKIAYKAVTWDGKVVQPHQSQPTQVPGSIFQVLNDCMRDMDHLASQHEVSQGIAPPNIESGSGVRSLQEADVLPLGPTSIAFEEAWCDVYNQMLSLAQQFYAEGRIIRVLGPTAEMFIHEGFSGKDIRPNIDVMVRPGTGIPRSRTAQRAEVLELVQTQVVSPQNAARILQVEGAYPQDIDYELDTRSAERENVVMAKGMPALVHTYDNHPLHVQVLERFQKYPQYDRLDEQIKSIFESHKQGHFMALGILPQPMPPGVPAGAPASAGAGASVGGMSAPGTMGASAPPAVGAG